MIGNSWVASATVRQGMRQGRKSLRRKADNSGNSISLLTTKRFEEMRIKGAIKNTQKARIYNARHAHNALRVKGVVGRYCHPCTLAGLERQVPA